MRGLRKLPLPTGWATGRALVRLAVAVLRCRVGLLDWGWLLGLVVACLAGVPQLPDCWCGVDEERGDVLCPGLWLRIGEGAGVFFGGFTRDLGTTNPPAKGKGGAIGKFHSRRTHAYASRYQTVHLDWPNSGISGAGWGLWSRCVLWLGGVLSFTQLGKEDTQGLIAFGDGDTGEDME